MRIYLILIAVGLYWLSDDFLEQIAEYLWLQEVAVRRELALEMRPKILQHSIQKWSIYEFEAQLETSLKEAEGYLDSMLTAPSLARLFSETPTLELVKSAYQELIQMERPQFATRYVPLHTAGSLNQKLQSMGLRDYFKNPNGWVQESEFFRAIKGFILRQKIRVSRQEQAYANYEPEVRWFVRVFPAYVLRRMGYTPIPGMQYQQPWKEIVDQAAKKHQTHSGRIYAILYSESRFQPEIVSRAGAVGLMQVMPETAAGLGLKNPSVQRLQLPEVSIGLGAHYLSLLARIMKTSDLMTVAAAYNAGPTTVRKWLAEDSQLRLEQVRYDETREYLKRVQLAAHHYQVLLSE